MSILNIFNATYFIEVFMLSRKPEYLYRVMGENICNGDDRDQGNAKITRVKKTEN